MKKNINSNLSAVVIITALISSLSSCKKQSPINETPAPATLSENIKTSNGRLVFKDNDAFYKTMEYLDKSGETARADFQEQYGFTSFGKAIQNEPDTYDHTPDENTLMNMPPAIQTLLNRDAEVQVGDDIVWYNNGTKYYVPETDAAQLEQIKQNPALADKKSSYFLEYNKPKNNATSDNGGITPNWIYLNNGADARHQLQFWQNAPAAGWRKYVHGVSSYTDYYYVASNTCGQPTYQYYTACYLDIKMEWKGSKWRPAGETRQITCNLTCQGSTTVARGCGIVDYPGFYITPVISTTSNTTYTITMGSYFGYTVSNSAYYPIGWSINVEGTIYQHVVGDVLSNQWYNTGFPLW
jgi:hypothetical protein